MILVWGQEAGDRERARGRGREGEEERGHWFVSPTFPSPKMATVSSFSFTKPTCSVTRHAAANGSEEYEGGRRNAKEDGGIRRSNEE
jgi:hypothetical protein